MAIVALLAAAVLYLYVRVSRLEQLVGERRRPVRTGVPRNTKVIPILKEEIEPGPFKKGNKLREFKRRETDE